MSTANVQLIQSFEDRFVAGDLDYVLSILTDDIVVHEPANVPYPGNHRGKESFLKLAQAFGKVWDLQGPLDLDIMPAGDDRVLVLVRGDAIAKPTGNNFELRIAEIYTIRDGKISDIVVHYWDTAEIVEVTNGVKVLQGDRN
ncbi:nuclear transport factor 2 family protein [Saccharomonospora viridis]|uniref:SnoaL-like domain-containing protein n=1 Tax=Saccharomonospora viridis TaxID=1852 RepID=A0A837D669_9PSEU|nr:nuclear transport factor 2 family protein [Saccharomonospora viridis]KHF43100.1 hypothetical protein MINT15_33020 [Saccharomonospora viridis]SFO84721.1 Ketosteroid isomerase-related protein [Saccharomonospora viridis]